MGSNRRFDISQNVAKSFVPMKKDLEEVAKETNKSLVEIYDMFLSDLQNYFYDSYNKKIEEIELSGFSRETITRLYEHVSKLKKSLEEKEIKERQRQEKQKLDEEKTQEMKAKWLEIQKKIDESVLDGKQGTEKEILQKVISDINQPNSSYELDSKSRKYIVKKLKARLEEINRKEENRTKQEKTQAKQKEEDTKKVESAMGQIEKIFEREHEKGKIKNKVDYLIAVKNTIIGENKNINLNIKIGEKEQGQLLQMLDEKIKTEKDEIYYEQVRTFTDDFRFLKSFSETANASYGFKKRKFTDIDSYHRYSALRARLLESNNEYLQINKLLESSKIEDVDKKILLARKEYMDREIENKNKVGQVR